MNFTGTWADSTGFKRSGSELPGRGAPQTPARQSRVLRNFEEGVFVNMALLTCRKLHAECARAGFLHHRKGRNTVANLS